MFRDGVYEIFKNINKNGPQKKDAEDGLIGELMLQDQTNHGI